MSEEPLPLPVLTEARHRYKKILKMLHRAQPIPPDDTNPCGGTNCAENEGMHHECPPPFSSACDNHKHQTAPKPLLELTTDVPKIGTGLCFRATQSLTSLSAGYPIGAYIGELINAEELARRQLDRADDPTYELYLEQDRYIDATDFGNELRYVNHSCTPNALYDSWVVKGATSCILTSLTTIKDGQEITADYYKGSPPSVLQTCLCATTNCSGIQGYPLNSRRKPPKRATNTNNLAPQTNQNTTLDPPKPEDQNTDTETTPPTLPSQIPPTPAAQGHLARLVQPRNKPPTPRTPPYHPPPPAQSQHAQPTPLPPNPTPLHNMCSHIDKESANHLLLALYNNLNPPQRHRHKNWANPEELLTDENIDAYLTHLANKYDAIYGNRPTNSPNPTWILDTQLFSNNILHNPESRKHKRFHRKIPVHSLHHVIIPVHHPAGIGHWTLIHIDIRPNLISHYDSLPNAPQHTAHNEAALKWWLRTTNNAGKENDWIPSQPPCPQQDDETSCGLFLLATTDHILSGKSTPSMRTHQTAAARVVILFSLAHGRDPTPAESNTSPPHQPQYTQATLARPSTANHPTKGKTRAAPILIPDDPPQAQHPKGTKGKERARPPPPPSPSPPPSPRPRTRQARPTGAAPTNTSGYARPPSSPPTGIPISLAEVERREKWHCTMTTWARITATLSKPHPPPLETQLTRLMLLHADHRVQETFELHTTWNILNKKFTPEPEYTTSPKQLHAAIIALDPTYSDKNLSTTIPGEELTAWSALSIRTLKEGFIFNTPETLNLASRSHPPTRALLAKHTSFHAPTNTFGPSPHFTTSAVLFYFDLHRLTPSDTGVKALSLSPRADPDL